MNQIRWTQVVIFGLVALLVVLIGAGLLSLGGGWGPGGMLGPGMMGPGMMGDWNFGFLGWLFMLLWLLVPLGLLALLALGIVWLFRQVGGPGASPEQNRQRTEEQSGGSPQSRVGPTCPNCGRPVQTDWRLCLTVARS